jgi:hypothetical protein
LDQPWWGSRDTLALSISDAARICGVKRRTIRRRLQTGEFEHAYKDDEGAWQIPVNDLLGAGLRPNLVTDPDEPRIVFSAASQVERLRTEVAVLRERVRALEIIAREREERVTDLRTILRMLPAPMEPKPEPEAAAEAIPEVTPQAPEALEASIEEEEAPPLEEAWQGGIEEEAPPLEEAWEGAPEEELGYEPLTEEEEGAVAWSSSAGEQDAGTSPFNAAPPTEPLLVLPDTPAGEAEPSEGALEHSAELLENARLRSDELLEDAMSMWWPSAPAAQRPSSAGVGAPSWGESEAKADVATRTAESPERPSAEIPVPRPPVHPEPDAEAPFTVQPAMPPEGGLFAPSFDDSSLDWLDPDFGRPPRHLRRGLGRFFRRHRKPK